MSKSSRGGIDISSMQQLSSRTPRTAREVAEKKARQELKAAGDSGASKKTGVERDEDLAAFYKARQLENLAKAKEQKQKQLLAQPTVSLIACACAGVARQDDLQFLIEKNVDLDDMVDGRSALMACCEYGSQVGMEALVRAGADVDLQNEQGTTALMIAVAHGHASIVSFLLDHSGANPALEDRTGHTALQCAYEHGEKQLASKLVRALAQPPAKITTVARDKVRDARLREDEKRRQEAREKKELLARTMAELKEEESKGK
jgi:hypothetical protein